MKYQADHPASCRLSALGQERVGLAAISLPSYRRRLGAIVDYPGRSVPVIAGNHQCGQRSPLATRDHTESGQTPVGLEAARIRQRDSNPPDARREIAEKSSQEAARGQRVG